MIPIRSIWLPVAAVRVACFEVAFRYRFVAVVFEADHFHLQALFSDPGFAALTIPLIEVGQIGVLEKSVFVALDWPVLDQW